MEPAARAQIVRVYPDLLQLVGKLAEVLGLAEHAQRILKTRRRQAMARHRAIDRSWAKFQKALVLGRGAIRQIRSTLAAQLVEAPADTVAIAMAYDDFSVFRNGLEQLHRAIGEMSKATYDLEGASEPISDEVSRFYRINEAGKPLLALLGQVIAGHPERIPELLDKADAYFARCENLIHKRGQWLER